MPFRDTAKHPLAWSHLAGREVSTWSEEWMRWRCCGPRLSVISGCAPATETENGPGIHSTRFRGFRPFALPLSKVRPETMAGRSKARFTTIARPAIKQLPTIIARTRSE